MPWFQTERAMIFVVSARWLYLLAMSRTSSRSPSESVVGSRPSEKNRSRLTLSSFSAASRRGFGRFAISTPVSLEMQFGQFADAVGLGDLVEHADLFAALRRVLQRDLDAADGVADVDERTGLSARAVHRQWVTDRRLHQEAIEDRAVVAVVVEAVDQTLVKLVWGVWVPQTMPWCRSVMRSRSFFA